MCNIESAVEDKKPFSPFCAEFPESGHSSSKSPRKASSESPRNRDPAGCQGRDGGVVAGGRGRIPRPAPAPRAPGDMLDTSTPECEHLDKRVLRRRHAFGRVSRRIFSRINLGLMIPGRYFFLTLTTTPTSPALVQVWNAWRMWLLRYRPGICWSVVFTDEGKGKGVIHQVVRIPPGQKWLDVRTVRK